MNGGKGELTDYLPQWAPPTPEEPDDLIAKLTGLARRYEGREN